MLVNKKLIVSLSIIFILVLVLACYTPMQSDDFGFYFKGLSLQAHLDLYLHWSGRVIVDFMSSAILLIKQPFIKALLSSLALPWLIYNIATLPYYKEAVRDNKALIFAIIILFASYWLSNPALGQTTFWIVGEANYLWPLVFVSAYIKYLLNYLYKEQLSVQHYFIIASLALLAGFSNEATGALVLYITPLLLLWAITHRLPHKKLILVAFIIAFVGFLVLILAPGNMERAANPEYAAWRAIPIQERIINHLFGTAPGILKSYGIIYLVLLWAFSHGRAFLNKQDWQLVAIFVSATVVFVLILIASPHAFIPRTQLTGLFFLLIVLSFLLKVVFYKPFSKLALVLIGCFLLTFILSYSCMLLAYQSIYRQSLIRLAIIDQAKHSGKQKVTIPSYYKPYTLRKGDLAELDYHNSELMGKYYGITWIDLVFVDFNYESVLASPCQTNYSQLTKASSLLQCFYAKKNILTGETTFVIKFSPAIQDVKDYKKRFSLKVSNTFIESDELHYEISLPLRIIQIGDHFFASANAVTNLLALNKKPEVIVKIYGPIKGGENIASQEVRMRVN